MYYETTREKNKLTMIPEYRRRALRSRGIRWPIRLRLLLIVPGSHPWNAWVRDVTARLEGHSSYDDETTERSDG